MCSREDYLQAAEAEVHLDQERTVGQVFKQIGVMGISTGRGRIAI